MGMLSSSNCRIISDVRISADSRKQTYTSDSAVLLRIGQDTLPEGRNGQIQPADVQELLEKGSRMVVLSRGMQLRLQTCPETLEFLKEKGIVVHVEETQRAARLYNKLAESELVGGLFHSTC